MCLPCLHYNLSLNYTLVEPSGLLSTCSGTSQRITHAQHKLKAHLVRVQEDPDRQRRLTLSLQRFQVRGEAAAHGLGEAGGQAHGVGRVEVGPSIVCTAALIFALGTALRR